MTYYNKKNTSLLYQRASLLHVRHVTTSVKYMRACARERERETERESRKPLGTKLCQSIKKYITMHNSARPQPFLQVLSQIYKQLSPIYKLQVASSNLTSALLASNRPHLPPVTDFLNRSIILHITHTHFGRKVHNTISRSWCCLASKRTQNLRAILLLNLS
jgi:hypothetical protein